MSRARALTLLLAAALCVPTGAAAAPEEGVADPVHGATSAQELAGIEAVAPAVVEPGTTALPAPQPGAQAFPRPADGVYDVTGGGFGHGIGMSQYGADGAGRAGLDHTEILAHSYPGTVLTTRSYDTIRIGITVDDDGVTRVAHRPGLQVSAGPGGTAYALPAGRDQWRVRAAGTRADSCVLEGRSGGTWTATWPAGMPRSCPVTFSSPTERTVDVFLPSGSLRVYRGAITATHIGVTSLKTVNALPMQEYLRSVVFGEMPSWFHTEALRSQAVAARTYAARGVNGTSYYDTCDTTWCQHYPGRGTRTGSGGISPTEHSATDAAVTATTGQVLTYRFPSGTALATTMYSSSNGGWSAAAGNGHDYLDAHADPYDAVAGNSRNTWKAQLPVTSLEARYGIHRVERVQVLRRDGQGRWGGRVLEARVEGFTATGAYTWARATGDGIMLARQWPAWSGGLSSTYFTFDAEASSASVTRVAGADRWGTSAAVAASWPAGVPVAYVVSGRDYPDALTAAARSGTYDAPVLLVDTDGVPAATVAALQRLRPARIVLVGGTTVVEPAVMDRLRGLTTSGSVQRVAGANRYGTAAAMAAFYPRGVQRVYLASGETYPDALAGAAAAAHDGAPLLLTRSTGLDGATRTQLARLRPAEVVVLGGTTRIPRAVADAAGAYSTRGTAVRVAGEDRYGTAELLAQRLPTRTTTAHLASGDAFPDALVAAALAGRSGSPLLLSRTDSVPPPTVRALERMSLTGVQAVGGPSVLTDTVLDRVADALR